MFRPRALRNEGPFFAQKETLTEWLKKLLGSLSIYKICRLVKNNKNSKVIKNQPIYTYYISNYLKVSIYLQLF
jgi:hypothetical protein